jgi:hypothetical protein
VISDTHGLVRPEAAAALRELPESDEIEVGPISLFVLHEIGALVPGTGIGAYPAYEYVAGEEALESYGDRWALVVFTPSGGINFDRFYYIPSRQYPEQGLGGVIERVGDWAYVHE